MEWVNIAGQTGDSTKGNTIATKSMEWATFLGLADVAMKVTGWMARDMEEENTQLKVVIIVLDYGMKIVE